MNIPCANDDEDFPVFKAGPPLPIRSKTKPNCKLKGAPLKATQSMVPSKSTSKTSSAPQNIIVTASTVNTESKVKQYIERVKANDERGRKARVKPEQMLSLEELYQVNDVVDLKCEESVNSGNSKNKNVKSLTDVESKLRETLRIVKEKDELINKLRESCHDLAIKCADAENRVDELRFSYGRPSTSVCADKESVGLNKGTTSVEPILTLFNGFGPRRSVSAEGLHTCGISNSSEAVVAQSNETSNKAKIDKATETITDVVKYDAHTQIETKFCQDGQCGIQKLSEHDGLWQQEDDILQETCSNWKEKVQNWKTDSNFNLSQDSGGDKDSGFRGSSAEIDAESILKNRHLSLVKAQRKCQGHGEKLLKVPQRTKTVAQLPEMSPSTPTITAAESCNHNQEQHEHEHLDQQHFWPSFSSSHSNLNNFHSANFSSDSTKAKYLFYETAEAERNKYACFQEGYSSSKQRMENNLQRLGGAKSLDLLYMPSSSHQTTEELKSLIDSSFDPPEVILKSHLISQHRDIDNKVKLLGPLLDDTTQIALRVKMKSERLAKILNAACALE